jgi:hypothetical protein
MLRKNFILETDQQQIYSLILINTNMRDVNNLQQNYEKKYKKLTSLAIILQAVFINAEIHIALQQ